MLRHISTFNHFLRLDPSYAQDRFHQLKSYTQLNPSTVADILLAATSKEGDKLLRFILGAMAQLVQCHAISPWTNEKLLLTYQWGIHQTDDLRDQLEEHILKETKAWKETPSLGLASPRHAVIEFAESLGIVARAYRYWDSQHRHIATALTMGCKAIAEIRTVEAHLAAGRLYYDAEGKFEASKYYKNERVYPDPYVIPHLNDVETELVIFTKMLLKQRIQVNQTTAA